MSVLMAARHVLDEATTIAESLAQACEAAVEAADTVEGRDLAIDFLSKFAQAEMLRRAAAQTYATEQRIHGIRRGLKRIGAIDPKTKLKPLDDAAPANPHEAGLRLLRCFKKIP